MNELEQAMRHPDVIRNEIKQNGRRAVTEAYSPDNPPPYPVTSVNGQTEDVVIPSGLTFDDIYPVGSIYMSVNSTSPASLFGGTWEQIEDKFLLAAGTTYSAGDTGGEATHTLTVNEIPSHYHKASNYKAISGWEGDSPGYFLSDGRQGSSTTTGPNTGSTGGGQPHNNMPPYLAVYIWKRTA